MIKIDMPEDVKNIINTIEKNGYEAFAVGGCIRDSILGKTPNDWDITTSARPEAVDKLFEKTIATGIEHGTVTVMINKKGYEVTTYRIDGEYTDGRHPDSVEYTEEITEDLSRRDFTINAMAYNDTRGFVDIFGGIDDLKSEAIRCVGEAEKRFNEDALRMMRAIRFSAQLGFDIEENTMSAIKKLHALIKGVSAERINIEFTKTMNSNPLKIDFFRECGLLELIVPEIDKIYDKEDENGFDVYERALLMAENSPEDTAIRLSSILSPLADILGVDKIKKILSKMRYDNKTIDRSIKILEYRNYEIHDERTDIKRLMSKFSTDEIFHDFLKFKESEAKSEVNLVKNKKYNKKIEINKGIFDEKVEIIKRVYKIYIDILEKKECFRLSDMDIGGKDIISAGVKPGKEVGRILNELLEFVINNPDQNKKEIFVKILKKDV